MSRDEEIPVITLDETAETITLNDTLDSVTPDEALLNNPGGVAQQQETDETPLKSPKSLAQQQETDETPLESPMSLAQLQRLLKVQNLRGFLFETEASPNNYVQGRTPQPQQELWFYIHDKLGPVGYKKFLELDSFEEEVLKRFVGLTDPGSQLYFGDVPHHLGLGRRTETLVSTELAKLILSQTKSELLETAYWKLIWLYDLQHFQQLARPTPPEFMNLVIKDLGKRLQLIFSWTRENYY